MLVRPLRKMQMGLLAYIRRLHGGGDAQICLIRLPQKLLTPTRIIKKSSSQCFQVALLGNSQPQRQERTNHRKNKYHCLAFAASLDRKPIILKAKTILFAPFSQHNNTVRRVDLRERSSSSWSHHYFLPKSDSCEMGILFSFVLFVKLRLVRVLDGSRFLHIGSVQ